MLNQGKQAIVYSCTCITNTSIQCHWCTVRVVISKMLFRMHNWFFFYIYFEVLIFKALLLTAIQYSNNWLNSMDKNERPCK